MPPARRLNLASKLLIWSCALIVVFFATTAYLFQQVRQDAEISNRIASQNHELDSAIQRMLERLYGVQDNIRRYKRLGNDEAVEFIVADLTRFGEILNRTLERHPQYRTEWLELTREFEITIDPSENNSDPAPNATVREWTDILEQSLLDNQADMQSALTGLYQAGEQATDIGLYGLIICLVIGIGGSLTLAYFINKSLTEIRRGIRDLGTGSPPRDVEVLSGDELGELALAFNAMAERLRREEQMRADFIAMLSHEIRTPLTSIREAVDLIGDGTFGEVNEKQLHFLSIAEKESIRLSDLLSRLMTVSRMESQSLDLQPEATDCAQLVESTLERLAPTAESKHVILTASLPDSPLNCTCDPGHIRQVLLNLLGNAIKFSSNDTEVVTSATADDHNVTICVKDNGPGIPADEQDKVFHKYYREPGVRDSVDGAGLGLSIAKRIVDAHGGRMWLESGTGAGSTFCFSLPIDGPKDIA